MKSNYSKNNIIKQGKNIDVSNALNILLLQVFCDHTNPLGKGILI